PRWLNGRPEGGRATAAGRWPLAPQLASPRWSPPLLVLVLADRSALAEVACAVGADEDASLLQHPRVLAVGRHRGAAQGKNATCFISMCGCPADGAMTVFGRCVDWQCTYERGAIPNAWCNQADGQCGRCNGVWCGSAGAAQD
ncbi:unnamed protein product, partial [Prorocentrum cordatum]